MTPVILTMLLVIILTMIFINSTSTTIELTVGLLIGMWGNKQVLMSNELQGFTALDGFLVLSYAVVGVTFIGRVLPSNWKFVNSRVIQRFTSDISKPKPLLITAIVGSPFILFAASLVCCSS
jgi:hypothetical protein